MKCGKAKADALKHPLTESDGLGGAREAPKIKAFLFVLM